MLKIRYLYVSLTFLCLVMAASPSFSAIKKYPLTNTSTQLASENLRGNIEHFHLTGSNLYGKKTQRDYWVYTPKQYDASQPTALSIFLDGSVYMNPTGKFRVINVLDNLIAAGEIPVMIAIFVNPANKNSATTFSNAYANNNRMKEYDAMSDTFSTFLITELISQVEKTHNLSTLAKDKAIIGRSSGGAGAFTAAWHRPDTFGRVMSHNGSFTNIIGANQYPALIRKTPKKPIKIYLLASKYDLNNQHGNWYLSNLQMASALEYKGYDYKLDEADDEHNSTYGGAYFPQAFTWLWAN